ncbi:serine/threonine protein kinase [Actinomadura sp. NBRC 104412]|uniref:Stk1 family PASTA domain-containing Ser/Thr kinase n=1 Tax=Actinomadura sp. NBRC 104412 TaxID=3032203 RepID=UPI0024A2EC53|nr:Stk1 family PASTA domain-containing Ser/Thr kinase [Actinomadura sp. NBRC 104412]GLZ03511.1 serine/threonine protein kinase [Actinomadura sp. NBRC 104412]
MDATVADPLVGQVLDGRYRIESRVARGGMATVYMGRDMRLDRTVAIKVMHAALATDEDFVRRFIGEAKAAAALSNPNVVAVYDQGTDGEHVYLVMEYVRGRTLRDLLTERGRLGPRAALEIMQPVLAALGAAHRAGLVHRDVKPENVLLTEDGQAKVADFGLARAETASGMTKTGVIIGTVGYLAPEQVLSGHADVRSDVYAAGVMLFELLTGTLPHQGDTPLAVAYKHVNDPIPAPSTRVPGLPHPLDALVLRATARQPQERPQDANVFLGEVAQVHAGLPRDIDQRVGMPAAQPRPAADGSTRIFDARTAPASVPPPRSAGDRALGVLTGRYVLIAIGAVAAVILGWAVWYQTSGQYDHVPDTIIGMPVADARAKLEDGGMTVRIGDAVYSDKVKKGEVARSEPGPGTRLTDGSLVTLFPSKGRVPREVPDVSGKPVDEARKILRDRGFTPGKVTTTTSQSYDRDHVIRTKPPAGQKQSPDEPVDIVVSRGMEMPSLVGRNGEEAANQLRSMGLDVDVDRRRRGSSPPGTVIEQSPSPGTGVSRGDRVRIVVNERDCFIGRFFCDDGDRADGEQIPVPDVRGQRVEDARRALRASGFKVRIGSRVRDTVVAQTPSGGNAPRGSEVTIWA